MDNLYVEVVFPLAVDKSFDYFVPDELKGSLEVGMRVEVEFNNSRRVGLVVELKPKTSIKKIKPLLQVLDVSPALSCEQLNFARNLSKEYLYSWGDFCFMMLPSLLQKRRKLKELSVWQIQNFNLQNEVAYWQGNFASIDLNKYYSQIGQTINYGSVMIIFPRKEDLLLAKEKLEKLFPGKIILFHSTMKDKEMLLNWQKMRQGNNIIIGTRRAIFFFPLNLNLLIIEEENSSYYFQPEKPFYHLRDIAFCLFNFRKLKLIYTGRYPSFWLYNMVKQGKVNQESLSEEKKVNIKIFPRNNMQRNIFLILNELLRTRLEKGENILITWDNKNFAQRVSCDVCNYIYSCSRCSCYLQFSLNKNMAICPRCGFSQTIDIICPKCKQGYIKPRGLGIERLQSILKRDFSQYPFAVWDQADKNTRIIFGSLRHLYSRINIDFELDTAFIFDADSQLAYPDFQATYEVFVAIRQVNFLVKGQINLFTWLPEHYIWQFIAHDYTKFYDYELSLRQKLFLPPFAKLIKLTIRGRDKNRLGKKALSLYNSLLKSKNSKNKEEFFGPVEDIPFKLRDYYRYNIIAKGKDKTKLIHQIEKIAVKARKSGYKIGIIIY